MTMKITYELPFEWNYWT